MRLPPVRSTASTWRVYESMDSDGASVFRLTLILVLFHRLVKVGEDVAHAPRLNLFAFCITGTGATPVRSHPLSGVCHFGEMCFGDRSFRTLTTGSAGVSGVLLSIRPSFLDVAEFQARLTKKRAEIRPCGGPRSSQNAQTDPVIHLMLARHLTGRKLVRNTK